MPMRMDTHTRRRTNPVKQKGDHFTSGPPSVLLLNCCLALTGNDRCTYFFFSTGRPLRLSSTL
jgi:hypothetical protein